MKYAIERADGHVFTVESHLPPVQLLEVVRLMYTQKDSFSTFTPHINTIPVRVYQLAAEAPPSH